MAGIVGLTELQHQNGTSALTIDESGRVTKPQTPAFHVSLATAQTLSTTCLLYTSDAADE